MRTSHHNSGNRVPSGRTVSFFLQCPRFSQPLVFLHPTFFRCGTLLARPGCCPADGLSRHGRTQVMGEKPQVMVVDDDLAMCSFLRTFLGARGYSAVTMTNADEAVPRFHADRPAAVLLDVVMPGSM